ncbi:hypothetical protein CLAIMM_14386 isoform 2 [Cladophialophora immunda]|nr:hypothetical protein CLAIMM_14386 isoform 2 [Cladophialophora immunda]
MDEGPVNIFEDQFMLGGFDGEHTLEPQSSTINPQLILNHSGLSQGRDVGDAGPGRQSTWSRGLASQCGRGVVTKRPQRTTQQRLRSSTIKNRISLGDKSTSTLGQEMRNAAQQARTFGGQLLDIKRYLYSPVDQCPGSDNFCRCNKALEEVQSEIPNLQARTSRIEKALAQVFEQMKQMEELNKTMMEGVRAICDGLNAMTPSSTLPNFTGLGDT